MKKLTVFALAAVCAAGVFAAEKPAVAEKPAAPAVAKRVTPKKPVYATLKDAKEAAEEHGQPILVVFLSRQEQKSQNFKREVLNRKEFKDFITNVIYVTVNVPPVRQENSKRRHAAATTAPEKETPASLAKHYAVRTCPAIVGFNKSGTKVFTIKEEETKGLDSVRTWLDMIVAGYQKGNITLVAPAVEEKASATEQKGARHTTKRNSR